MLADFPKKENPLIKGDIFKYHKVIKKCGAHQKIILVKLVIRLGGFREAHLHVYLKSRKH